MSDEAANSRRDFLKWLGLAPGALLVVGAGCGSSTDAGRISGGMDVGGGQPDASAADASMGGADVSAAPDVGAGRTDGGADASPGADAGEICEPTGSDVEGPFHLDGAPERRVLAGPEEAGERIVIEGQVLGPDCRAPVADALLDVWHADANGDYHDDRTEYRLRGQMRTDAEGRYRFETIKPGRYPLGGSTRPAHIHFMVSKPGFVPLTTQLYFEGDPFLSPNDPCGTGCNSGDPTLIVALVGGEARFDIVMRSS